MLRVGQVAGGDPAPVLEAIHGVGREPPRLLPEQPLRAPGDLQKRVALPRLGGSPVALPPIGFAGAQRLVRETVVEGA